MEPWFRASLSGFEPEIFHFLDLGQYFPLCAPQFPHLLMGMITFTTLQLVRKLSEWLRFEAL